MLMVSGTLSTAFVAAFERAQSSLRASVRGGADEVGDGAPMRSDLLVLSIGYVGVLRPEDRTGGTA